MKIYFPSLTSTMAELKVAPEDQGRVVAAAGARAIGYHLPLPVQEQSNLAEFWDAHIKDKAEALVGALNEQFPVNFDQTLELIRKVWELRCGFVWPRHNLQALAVLEAAAANGAFGEPGLFNDERLAVISRAMLTDLPVGA